MKRCSTCKKEKSLNSFYNNKTKRDGKSFVCRQCKSDYNKRWYKNNKEKHIADVVANNLRYKELAKKVVGELKKSPCTDCGGCFPEECMDFDHTKGDKIAAISTLVHGKKTVSLDVLRKELSKCELVCANCHRTRTKIRRLHGEADITQDS